jgi:hypothetical protein
MIHEPVSEGRFRSANPAEFAGAFANEQPLRIGMVFSRQL